MGIQLRLPGLPAFPPLTSRDPREVLRQLERDKADARVEIRSALDRLAAKHGIKPRAINYVMADYAARMLDDATYEVQRELEFEIEAKSQSNL
jgi:hypothetical protein